MLAVLSPAKKQQFDNTQHTITNRLFPEETNELIHILRQYPTDKLRELMHISEDLAQLNHIRFQNFNSDFSKAESHAPAVLAFQGDAYRSLAAHTFTAAEQAFCADNLIILSGLYGLLRAYDTIQPYRLEMKTPLTNPQGKDLYAFWDDKLARATESLLANHQHRVLVNLASGEYSKAIGRAKLSCRVIDVDFKEAQDGYRTIGIHAKRPAV